MTHERRTRTLATLFATSALSLFGTLVLQKQATFQAAYSAQIICDPYLDPRTGCTVTCEGQTLWCPEQSCGDGFCGSGEGMLTCPADCALPRTSTCGNQLREEGEECDLGAYNGPLPLSDCSLTCRINRGGTGASCGNGQKEGAESCDDGNATARDGCGTTCRIERGYECPTAGQPCRKICGNGRLDAGETCDDRNSTSGDGCSASCKLERGYECPVPSQACRKICGNGRVDTGETCDDRNTTSGDGCSASCKLERGYECPTAGQTCRKICGNGRVDTGETCDDRNGTSGDGCSKQCKVETGYTCTGTPSSCTRRNTSQPQSCRTIGERAMRSEVLAPANFMRCLNECGTSTATWCAAFSDCFDVATSGDAASIDMFAASCRSECNTYDSFPTWCDVF